MAKKKIVVATPAQVAELAELAKVPAKAWEQIPPMPHIGGAAREELERRVRLRKVRYLLFRYQTQLGKRAPLSDVPTPPGFEAFWLGERPLYQVDPTGKKIDVPPNKRKQIADLGGYASFAKVWDVDADLYVYLRHSSVWQEWNARLARSVPILGES